jgi:hypothetical protein
MKSETTDSDSKYKCFEWLVRHIYKQQEISSGKINKRYLIYASPDCKIVSKSQDRLTL